MANALPLVALLVAGCAALASATTYNVGDSRGWTTGVDYTSWGSGKSFAVGDKLVFSYVSKMHTVTEVSSKSAYDACSGNGAVSDDESGSTTVTLTTPGTHYFICNVPGHCAGGMKFAITVSATPSGATASAGAPSGSGGGDGLRRRRGRDQARAPLTELARPLIRDSESSQGRDSALQLQIDYALGCPVMIRVISD